MAGPQTGTPSPNPSTHACTLCTDSAGLDPGNGAGCGTAERSVHAFFYRETEPVNAIYTVGGTVDSQKRAYVKRAADDELLERCLRGEFTYILSSRQVGKSSLM